MSMTTENCICCGKNGRFSILLAVGPNNTDKKNDTDRYYIPNDAVRKTAGTSLDPTEKVSFCGDCMRKVEDNLRATILYLQSENGLMTVTDGKGRWKSGKDL